MKSNIPNLIREYLEANNMTQKDFADLLGWTPSQLSRLLHSNPARIDLDTTNQLRDVIGFSPADVFMVVDEDKV